MSKINPSVGKRISRTKFEHERKKFEKSFPELNKAVFLGADTFKRLLDVPGMVGAYIYFGLDDAGNLNVMLAPANADNKLIMGGVSGKDGEDPSNVENNGLICPPVCPGLDD